MVLEINQKSLWEGENIWKIGVTSIVLEEDRKVIEEVLGEQLRRDEKSVFHQYRVSEISSRIAEKLELPPLDTEIIGLAGLCHDVGKEDIPLQILNKQGALNENERLIVSTHIFMGYARLVRKVSPIIYEIASQHHEKFDGSGYPRGLKGNQISLGGRILLVADELDAGGLRGLGGGISKLFSVFDQIKNNTRGWYDPEVVDACESVLSRVRFGVGLGFRFD